MSMTRTHPEPCPSCGTVKTHTAEGGYATLLWLVVFLACFGLYLATANRGFCWQDSGWNQLRALDGDYSQSVPLARAHVLYIAGGHLLAKISPGYMPFAFNALSSLWMAIALANLAVIGATLTGRRWIGLAVAATLALTHTTWWLATINESYAWVLAGFTAEIYLLIRLLRGPSWGTLAALSLISGLGLCVHNFALLPLPVYAIVACWLVAKRKIPAWSLAVAAGAYLVGSGVFLGMIVASAIRNGSVAWALRDALTGQYASSVLNMAGAGRYLKANLAISALNFINLLAPLAIVGLMKLRARLGGPLAVALTAISAIQFIFFVRYPVPDQFMFILPSLACLAVLACVGLDVLAGLVRPRWRAVLACAMLASALVQPVVYVAASDFAQRNGPIRKRQLPFRNEANYWLTPWKHDKNSAEKFARLALQAAAPHGVILADNTSIYPLLLAQRLAKDNKFAEVSIYRGPDFLSKARQEWPGCNAIVACQAKLAGREFFVVHNQPGALPPELREKLNLTKTPNSSLYRAAWR